MAAHPIAMNSVFQKLLGGISQFLLNFLRLQYLYFLKMNIEIYLFFNNYLEKILLITYKIFHGN